MALRSYDPLRSVHTVGSCHAAGIPTDYPPGKVFRPGTHFTDPEGMESWDKLPPVTGFEPMTLWNA